MSKQENLSYLNALASPVEPRATWDHLNFLSHTQLVMLHDIVAHVRRALREKHEISPRLQSQGVIALLLGPGIRGKSMAAEVIGRDLGLDLYKIDLSTVISKYVGKTQKNLCRIFDAAVKGGAILFFDESDVLFGVRSEVKDSDDRYANIEINYLLKRMETFSGLVILCANTESDLDQAFIRRLTFIVEFPFPDSEERESIWQSKFPDK